MALDFKGFQKFETICSEIASVVKTLVVLLVIITHSKSAPTFKLKFESIVTALLYQTSSPSHT
jgi:hypothetical protein